MIRTPHDSADAGGSQTYRVEPPRASDAIGASLRDAFDRDLGLPDDMLAMLRDLNAGGHARAPDG
jgi:hypothetical protein